LIGVQDAEDLVATAGAAYGGGDQGLYVESVGVDE
jgi:hypothetical protein